MNQIHVPVMAELAAAGKSPDILYWVGCAGAFDERYKKVSRSFAKLLNHAGVNYAVLGKEESCTGDAAKRAGNEMLFQMQALNNIEILNGYGIKKIVCTCPHCFNTLKNEYPELGGNYEVLHYTTYLEELIDQGKLKLDKSLLNDKRITYHDPCYLGRANSIYDAPRNVLGKLGGNFSELKRHKSKALCCGAGGAQMFKEAEKGNKEVYAERTDEIIESKAEIVATACPFCMVMLTDGIKFRDQQQKIKNLDLAELLAENLGI
ncbi:MAG: CoB--CoM heterodisulfide reductase [Bacteroidetes bacterium HGW-Bacteroidetes-4]|jgi:Fe-S oxidoreductase|nr:MAG: CoB--CoM heterodisulfide reductase [Bacteroidetes bacterium HGW-Bacteroidetes-4]